MNYLKFIKRISISIVSIILLLYIYNLFSPFIFGGSSTQIATNSLYYDKIDVNGIAVRNETILNIDKNQNVLYTIDNGTKVASGSEIARVYSDINSINMLNSIQNIDHQINILNSIASTSVSYFKQDQISNSIYSDIKSLNKNLFDNNFMDLENNKIALLKSLSEREKLLNKGIDLADRVNELNRQKANLQASMNKNYKNIYSNESGYFVNYIDSYESVINQNNYASISLNDMEAIINSQDLNADYTKIGKIISDYKWRYIFIVENSFLKNLKEGSVVELNFKIKNISSIPAVVESIKVEGEKAMVTLSCQNLTQNLVNFRVSSCEVVLNKYSGIKINKSALRIKDGENGVYVLENNYNIFKRLKILFEDQYFIISSGDISDEDKSKYVTYYDEILLN